MPALKFAYKNLFDGVGFGTAGAFFSWNMTPDADTSDVMVYNRSRAVLANYTAAEETADQFVNGDFSAWTGDDPDSWTTSESVPNSEVTQVSSTAQFTSDGTAIASVEQGAMAAGSTYRIQLVISAYTSGTVQLYEGATLVNEYTSSGTKNEEFTSVAGGVVKIQTKNAETCDFIIDTINIRYVYPLAYLATKHIDFDDPAYLPDAVIIPAGHNLDGIALAVYNGVIDGTPVLVKSWTQSGSGIIVEEFTDSEAEAWYLSYNEAPTGDPTVSLSEIFFTQVIQMSRVPSRPGGDSEDFHNTRNDMTAGGQDRFLEYGDSKKQRNYEFPNIGEADKDILLNLWDAWAGKNPFWLCDHDGTWVFVKFAAPLLLREIAFERYEAEVKLLEVF